MPSTTKRRVLDPPEWTAEDFARAKRFPDGLPPEVAAAWRENFAAAQRRRQRGRQRTPTKVAISLRVDRAALAAYRATGRGWQTRLSADISGAAKRLPRRRAG